ncbi:DinB family protein [Cognatiyoonia sp. IB215446]|uniref:DinB family protein n=1 Tax=Cognatiyoonia sp. IB215446 TaxID=3097355 RepID=UPI002A1597BD|nr:DinB family protein [Cognatiyoonia sp. IB215446]MDX8348052.1 DinB family protein [Cognatiyoonia sp. IB215446]
MTMLFRAQAYNNAWANHRLGKACLQLSGDDLAKTRESFFGSIIATLNHILIVDWFYVSALEGQCMGPSAFDDEIPCPEIEALVDQQKQIDARLIRACAAPDEALGPRIVTMERGHTIQKERFDRTFLHLIQHQIHHRGQVHGLLSDAGLAPPQLDEFYLAWEPDRTRRAGELEELGITEEAIWGDAAGAPG